MSRNFTQVQFGGRELWWHLLGALRVGPHPACASLRQYMGTVGVGDASCRLSPVRPHRPAPRLSPLSTCRSVSLQATGVARHAETLPPLPIRTCHWCTWLPGDCQQHGRGGLPGSHWLPEALRLWRLSGDELWRGRARGKPASMALERALADGGHRGEMWGGMAALN